MCWHLFKASDCCTSFISFHACSWKEQFFFVFFLTTVLCLSLQHLRPSVKPRRVATNNNDVYEDMRGTLRGGSRTPAWCSAAQRQQREKPCRKLSEFHLMLTVSKTHQTLSVSVNEACSYRGESLSINNLLRSTVLCNLWQALLGSTKGC